MERCFGYLELREQSFAHVGLEMLRQNEFSAQLIEWNSTDAPKTIPTPPEFGATRRRPLLLEEVRMRQCKLGELCRSAAVLRPDIFAPIA